MRCERRARAVVGRRSSARVGRTRDGGGARADARVDARVRLLDGTFARARAVLERVNRAVGVRVDRRARTSGERSDEARVAAA